MSAGKQRHIVVADDRLDRVVATIVGSRNKAKETLASGKVRVQGIVATAPGELVKAGVVVEVWWNEPGTSVVRNEGKAALDRAGVRLVEWATDFVVCDKPPGLLTDAATQSQRRDEDSLVGLLRRLSAPSHPRAVHRIDRDTSGLVLVARGDTAYEALRAEFAAHRPARRYLTLLHGDLAGDQGTWEDAMLWDSRQLRQRVPRPGEETSLARASWQVLVRGRAVTLVEVRLDTGRRNQIRLHACLRGHPVVGERLYLPPRWRRPSLETNRQWLHAASLSVQLPDGRVGAWSSPIPQDLKSVLDSNGVRCGPDGRV